MDKHTICLHMAADEFRTTVWLKSIKQTVARACQIDRLVYVASNLHAMLSFSPPCGIFLLCSVHHQPHQRIVKCGGSKLKLRWHTQQLLTNAEKSGDFSGEKTLAKQKPSTVWPRIMAVLVRWQCVALDSGCILFGLFRIFLLWELARWTFRHSSMARWTLWHSSAMQTEIVILNC